MVSEFVGDILEIRQRLREEVAEGAIASSVHAEHVIRLLNEVLAVELICVLCFKRRDSAIKELHADFASHEFLQRLRDEEPDVEHIAERIIQLGGKPNFNSEIVVKRRDMEHAPSKSMRVLLKEDLTAERIAVATYMDIACWLRDKDPPSRLVMEKIIKTEDQRVEYLTTLLGHISE